MSRGRRGVGPVEIQIACGSTSKIYNGFFFSVTDAIEMVNVEASARVALSLWVKILFSNNQGFANSRSIAGARIVCEILIYLIALKNLRHGMLTVVQESSVAEKPLPNASLCMAVRHASRRKSASPHGTGSYPPSQATGNLATLRQAQKSSATDTLNACSYCTMWVPGLELHNCDFRAQTT